MAKPIDDKIEQMLAELTPMVSPDASIAIICMDHQTKNIHMATASRNYGQLVSDLRQIVEIIATTPNLQPGQTIERPGSTQYPH